MALDSYANLKTSIASWLNDDELTSQIPDFIRLAEAEFNRREEIVEERFEPLTLSASPVNLPADCQVPTQLFYDETAAHGPIEVGSMSLLAERRADFMTTGRPRFAAVTKNGQLLYLGPAPDQSYVAYLEYETKLTPLSASASNWLLDEHPDIYLWGSLLQAAPFLHDDARIPTWETRLEKAFAQVRRLNHRRKYGTNTLVRRPRRAIG